VEEKAFFAGTFFPLRECAASAGKDIPLACFSFFFVGPTPRCVHLLTSPIWLLKFLLLGFFLTETVFPLEGYNFGL